MLADGEKWKIFHTDCITHMAELPARVFDFSVFSPPFPSLYSYSSESSDIGNSEDLKRDAPLHLSFFYRQLARLIKPGRVVMVHVCQIPRMKRVGGRGMHDFRGLNIRLGERAGLIYEYDWMIRKNPQAQAVRSRSRELQFAGLESDRARSRGTMNDYLIKFMVPGEDAVPVDSEGDVSRHDWISWAEGCWGDIRETDTLNGQRGKDEARGEEDILHICPLQLPIIDRLVRLYTNPGEIVFSPFAGIGSELVTAVKRGRRAYGCELKREYYETAIKNLKRAEKSMRKDSSSLFSVLGGVDD